VRLKDPLDKYKNFGGQVLRGPGASRSCGPRESATAPRVRPKARKRTPNKPSPGPEPRFQAAPPSAPRAESLMAKASIATAWGRPPLPLRDIKDPTASPKSGTRGKDRQLQHSMPRLKLCSLKLSVNSRFPRNSPNGSLLHSSSSQVDPILPLFYNK
jgi:hypothetical protein